MLLELLQSLQRHLLHATGLQRLTANALLLTLLLQACSVSIKLTDIDARIPPYCFPCICSQWSSIWSDTFSEKAVEVWPWMQALEEGGRKSRGACRRFCRSCSRLSHWRRVEMCSEIDVDVQA